MGRRDLRLGLALLASVGVIGLDPAAAEPAATIVAQPAVPGSPAIDPFGQIVTARGVAEFARRQKDPQAMLVAARMLQEVPIRDASGSDPSLDAAFTPPALFAEAKALAKGDPLLTQQIAIAQANGSRGVFDSAFGKGLVRLVREVAARAAYRFDVRALGGQVLRVGAIGDIGTAMVLRLLDAAGRVVCSDDNGDYAPVCATMPKATSSYHVEVVNRSARPSRAVILSN